MQHRTGKEQPGDHNAEPLTVGCSGNSSSSVAAGATNPCALTRPVELLHRRKIYVEGPRQLVGSSSSELSTAALNAGGIATTTSDVNYRNRERQTNGDTPPSGVGQQQSNNSRQISPASCNSESVASSNVGSGSCGLCGLMPHCAILEAGSSSAKARKIRGNTVIVEEEAPETKTTAAGLDKDNSGAAATGSRLQQQQQRVSSSRSAAGGELTAAGGGATGAKNHRMSKFNSSSMDRSVDSIGSCSLDVDADSTDFSGTQMLAECCYTFASGWTDRGGRSGCVLFCLFR